MKKSVKIIRILVLAGLLATLAACASSVLTGKSKVLSNFNESLLKRGQGAVMLHALNKGGLIATRWYKVDDPDRKHSFTVYRSDRHRALDRLDMYDVVMVEPGAYVLYSVFSNCEDGLRPGSTDWDEPLRPEVASAIGMVSWLRSWKPGGDLTGGVGIWGGSGSRSGVSLGGDLGGVGVGSGPGTPIAVCNLLSPGLHQGKPILATVTVRAGEVVYAGEINIDYGAESRCETLGNWMTDNEMRQYCGADWVTLKIRDGYQAHARPFIEKHLGPEAAGRAVVRLAEPGSMVSVK